MTAKERMQERIERHGRNLLAIFPHATEQDPVKLCKKLRRLESKAVAIGLRLCNGPDFEDQDEPDRLCDTVLLKVNELLGNYEPGDALREPIVPVFINRDPRGHALKIRDEWMAEHKAPLHRDWGGYGILAPEIDGKP